MDIKEHLKKLDQLANSSDQLNNLSLLDLGYCVRLRGYYIDYANNLIDMDNAQKSKDKLQNEYILLYGNINQGLEVYKQYQENIKKSEMLRSDINKSSNLNDMLIKSLEIISLLTGDKTLYDINARKI